MSIPGRLRLRRGLRASGGLDGVHLWGLGDDARQAFGGSVGGCQDGDEMVFLNGDVRNNFCGIGVSLSKK